MSRLRTRQDYIARIKDLEDQLSKKNEELKMMLTMWTQVVRQPKPKESNKVSVFGGKAEIQ